MRAGARKIVVILLLIFGVQLWLIVGRSQWGHLPPLWVLILIALAALLPAANRPINQALDRIRDPSPRARLITALIVAILCGIYLYTSALWQHRSFELKVHDEHCYAIAARMLATGRLWLPSHPAAESFDAPYLITRPVYASMFFPGLPLALVPFVWLGIGLQWAPLLMCAAAAGLLYRVTTELIDGVAGLLAALLLLCVSVYREECLRLYSQVPLMLGGLALTWAWLRWRKQPNWRRAALIGAIAGWMLIVRPVDAFAFVVPIAIACAMEFRIARWPSIAVVFLAAAPFLLLQLIANHGISGRWLQTPHQFYSAHDAPGLTFGFHRAAPIEMLSTRSPLKRSMYEGWSSSIDAHTPTNVIPQLVQRRLPLTAVAALPNNLLLILLPAGLLGVAARGRWVLAAPIALFLLLYLFYLFYMAHYVLVIAPALVFLIVLGCWSIIESFPMAHNALRVLLIGLMMTVALWSLPESNRLVRDDLPTPEIDAVNAALQSLQTPASVLFASPPHSGDFNECVYNSEVASIDDAKIIRALDLPGQANDRLLAYYSTKQPQRRIYRIARDGERITVQDLGMVGEKSRQP